MRLLLEMAYVTRKTPRCRSNVKDSVDKSHQDGRQLLPSMHQQTRTSAESETGSWPIRLASTKLGLNGCSKRTLVRSDQSVGPRHPLPASSSGKALGTLTRNLPWLLHHNRASRPRKLAPLHQPASGYAVVVVQEAHGSLATTMARLRNFSKRFTI